MYSGFFVYFFLYEVDDFFVGVSELDDCFVVLAFFRAVGTGDSFFLDGDDEWFSLVGYFCCEFSLVFEGFFIVEALFVFFEECFEGFFLGECFPASVDEVALAFAFA